MFNNTERKFRDNVTIHQLFEEQVSINGSEIAVLCDHEKTFNGKKSLTYEELNSLSNSLAKLLRENGVTADKVVGICVDRSFAMIIGILGILKAGGAYLPLAPDFPKERISYMLSDSSAEILLVQDKTNFEYDFDGKIINIENIDIYSESSENLTSVSGPRDLAYVIYTSGSTGKPKGVMVEHRSLVNRLSWMQNAYTIDRSDVILQKTPFYFDVSVWEIFWWAITGAKMCFLMPGGEKIPLAIVEAIKKYNVSILHFVPSMLNVFLEYLEGKDISQIKKLSSVRKVFSSGEALSLSHVKKYNNFFGQHTSAQLTNLYGPTEATVDVSYYNCPLNNGFDKVPIGKPIDNIKFYVIKEGQLQSIGETGELCISGVGLARGYINNPDLTNEKFVDNPFLPGEKMYKTGDIARWLPDGNIEYLGREDHQVKIRGLRIELGEIETTIREFIGVQDCIVTVKKFSENIILIIAYIVWRAELNIDGLKNNLKKYLPEYMIPNHFIELDQIPLLPNGKADRKSLPEPILNVKQ
ncbi:MAG: amino acid adenylation domain-containing protein [Ignavibacteriaceae bacterium]|nr:amino acid adenylation domain-containing protein [Ignavibacteriaceae bacterium]